MTTRSILTGWILAACCGLAFAGESAQTDSPAVRVYLPRELAVSQQDLTLDHIAHIGGDDALADKVRTVKIGRAPFPGETLVLTRKVLQARLASEGFYAPTVQLTGSEQISLQRDTKALTPNDFVNAAEEFLRNHPPAVGATWRVVRRPAEVLLPANAKITIQCSQMQNAPSGHVNVSISVLNGKKLLTRQEVLFKLTWKSYRAVTTQAIAKGSVLTDQNVKIETVLVERQPEERWTPPYGQKALRAMQVGTVITDNLTEKPKPVLLVKRNRPVRIRVRFPDSGVTLTTLGLAMQDGHVGELIRVQNTRSKKIIVGKVDEQGDVVPLLRQ